MPRTITRLAGRTRRRVNIEQLLSLLDDTEPRTARCFAAAAEIVELPRRGVVYKAGEPSSGLYVVIAGRVKLSLPLANSEERVLALIESGCWFGESALILGTPHANTASAVEPTTLAHIPTATFLDCLQRDRLFAAKLLTEESKRLRVAMIDTAATLIPARERVVCWLLNEVARKNSAADSAEIVLPAPKHVLASRLHMTPAHLSRMFEDLKRAELIEVRARRILVPSVARLKSAKK